MGTHGYRYNQIRVRIHILMDSQIPVYYTLNTRLTTRPVPVTDFTHEYPWACVILPPYFHPYLSSIARLKMHKSLIK